VGDHSLGPLGETNYTGYAYINTFGDSNDKTCIVDYAASYPYFDEGGMGIRHYLGMEPGHVAGARHTECAVDRAKYPDGSIEGQTSMMKDYGDPVECYKETNVDQVYSWYSTCEEDAINSNF
jgi:hypothetical protein